MQVADGLSDSAAAIDVWIHMLAKHALALGPPWQSYTEGEDMLCALLRLPRHLRTRVLSACIGTPSKTLEQLLDAFPSVFHANIIACAVTSCGGTLEVPSMPHERFFPLLAAAAATMSKPGLVSLTASGALSSSDSALLADALAHHSTIESLTIGACGSGRNLGNINAIHLEGIRTLGLCLPPASLPNLKDLDLSMHMRPSLASAATLSIGLKSFPTITSLCLNCNIDQAQAAGTLPAACNYVAAATGPAALTHLRTMAIEEFNRTGSHLTTQYSGMNILLPLIFAPALTRLSFTSNLGLISWEELLCSLQQCSNLQVLTLDTDLRMGYAWPGGMHSAEVTPSGSRACPALPSLHSLDITSQCMLAACQMTAMMASHAMASLTRITLRHQHAFSQASVHRVVSTPSQEETARVWDIAIAVVSRCSRLRRLRMRMPRTQRERSSPYARDRTGTLAGAIGRLSLLTELRLDGICQQCWPGASGNVPGKAFGQALRVLPRLQRLHIAGGGAACSVSDSARMLDALPTLNNLSFLGLCCGGIDQAAVGELIPKLRVLKELHLDAALFGMHGVATEAEFAARFPKVMIMTCKPGR